MYNFTKNHSLGFRSPLQSWHVLSSTNKNFLERKTKQKNKVRRRGLQVKREIKAETREAENHTAIILLLAALALQGSPSVEETASGTSPFRRESSPAVGTRHSPRLSPQGAPGSAVLGHFAWFLARCGPSTNRFSECNRWAASASLSAIGNTAAVIPVLYHTAEQLRGRANAPAAPTSVSATVPEHPFRRH